MRNILTAIVISLLTLPAMAQHNGRHQGENRRFNPEEFKNRMEQFIMRKADLTPEEAKVFVPVYSEFKDKQRDIQRRIMKLKQIPADNTSVDFEKTVMEIARLDNEAAALETTYYKRLCKKVPAHKVYRVIIAVDNFHRQMLRDFNRKGHRKEGRGPKAEPTGEK